MQGPYIPSNCSFEFSHTRSRDEIKPESDHISHKLVALTVPQPTDWNLASCCFKLGYRCTDLRGLRNFSKCRSIVFANGYSGPLGKYCSSKQNRAEKIQPRALIVLKRFGVLTITQSGSPFDQSICARYVHISN